MWSEKGAKVGTLSAFKHAVLMGDKSSISSGYCMTPWTCGAILRSVICDRVRADWVDGATFATVGSLVDFVTAKLAA